MYIKYIFFIIGFSITVLQVSRDVCQFIKLLQGDLHWKNLIALAVFWLGVDI